MNKYVLFTVLVVAYFTAAAGVACPAAGSTNPPGANYVNCSTCDTATIPNCVICNSGYGIYTVGTNSLCAACDPTCANCTQAGNPTQCVASNDYTQATNTAPQICAVMNTTGNATAPAKYQSYLPGAFVLNSSTTPNVNTYTCYSCPVNCTNCSSSTGYTVSGTTRPTAAVTTCTTCQTNTSFVSNNATSYGCFFVAPNTTTNTTSTTGTTGTTTGTTLAATASCSTTDANGNCLTCPVSYVATNISNKTICAVCSPACLNCRAPADSTMCVNSNISAYNNASAATPCGNYTYPTQTYLAGAMNSTSFTYTCYPCAYNCTDCTLSNGSKPTAAVTGACKSCVSGTSLQTVTINGTTATGCFVSSSSVINAGLTIGAVMTVLVSLLL